jgi:hypothetical protein
MFPQVVGHFIGGHPIDPWRAAVALHVLQRG